MYFLYGRIYLDQASAARHKKQYDQALALCNKALKYGDCLSFYRERTRIHLNMGNLAGALADADRAVSLDSLNPAGYRQRATVFLNLKNPQEAKGELMMAERLSPGDPENHEWFEWAARYYLHFGHEALKTDPEKAIADYDVALELNPTCAEAFYWRGGAYYKLGRPARALADCRRTIDLDPHHFSAYRMMDYLLASEQKWDEIIAYWNRYLVLVPDQADAYLERAGAYRRQGNMAKAFADLERSCELGNEQACRLYEREK
jgi:tetratricopeptide (TPR) repeat protein